MLEARLSRRAALAAGAVALTTPSLEARSLSSQSAPAQPPRWIRFKVGSADGLVLSDGSTWLSPIQPTFAPEATKAELDAALDRAFHPRDRARIEFNVALLRFGDATILVDAGSGGATGPFGRVREHLRSAGVELSSIDLVIVSHAHGDHVGGLLDLEGKPSFPNARIAISRVEHDFWTSAAPDLSRSRLPAERKQRMAADARRTLESLAGRIDLIDAGTRLHPRIELLDTRGHTPGHLSLVVRSDGAEGDLCVMGDIAHNHVAMFADPDWTSVFDVDPLDAARTRRTFFDRMVAEPMRILAYHLPWPGFGWVRRHGNGYEWVVDAIFA
jgi:glyoxylase-like metal-dependent hydrolase (beta-lactamase superfamily II)